MDGYPRESTGRFPENSGGNLAGQMLKMMMDWKVQVATGVPTVWQQLRTHIQSQGGAEHWESGSLHAVGFGVMMATIFFNRRIKRIPEKDPRDVRNPQ